MSGGPRSLPKLLLGALGVLVVLVGAAWAVLAIAFPPEKVRKLVNDQLSHAVTREVRIEGASLSLWPPVRFVLKQPALAEPGGFAKGTALSAVALDLDVDPFALLARRLVIRRLALDRPALHLLLRADGTTNFDNLMRPATPTASTAKPEQPMDLAIQELALKGARVLIDDVRAGRRTAFAVDSRVALELKHGDRIGTSGRTTFSDLARGPLSAQRVSDLDRRLADLSLTLEHRGQWDGAQKRLALDRLALQLGKAEVVMVGTVDDPGAHTRMNLSAKGSNLDLAELLRALSAAELPALHGVSGSGNVDFDLTARGELAPGRLPALIGALRLKDGAFRYPGAPLGVSGLGFTARFAPDSLGIGDLAGRVGDQPVRATLALTRFADPHVRFSVDGNVDLAAVGPLVAPADTKLGGRVALRVSGEGRARDPGTMALGGTAQLSDVSVKSPQLPQTVEHVRGDLTFSGARATVRGLSASAGQSSFAMDATIDRPLALMAKVDSVPPAVVDFSLNSPYLDMKELLPPTPSPALMPNARGQGRIAIGRLKQDKLDVQHVQAAVTFDPRTFSAPNFGLDGYGGRVSGNAKFDLTDPANPGFQVKAKIDSVQADALLSAWTPAKNILKGALSTTIDLSGAGLKPEQLQRTLTAIGIAGVANGEIGPAPALEAIAALTKVKAFQKVTFQHLDLPFKVENGKIAMREVGAHGPSGDWKASGLIGFDGGLDYVVNVLVPQEQIARLGANAALAAGALTDPQGRVRIDLRVLGTAKAPRVTLDTDALRAAALGKVTQAFDQQKSHIEEQLQHTLNPTNLTGDSARAAASQNLRALADSLKKKKGSDILKDLFGGAKKKPAAVDTAARDTTKR